MKKAIIYSFLIVLLFGNGILAQVESFHVKGEVPFNLMEHIIVIKGKINGSENQYDFLVDTGAITFIDRVVVEELGLKTKGNMAKLKMLEIGEVRIPNIFAFTTE